MNRISYLSENANLHKMVIRKKINVFVLLFLLFQSTFVAVATEYSPKRTIVQGNVKPSYGKNNQNNPHNKYFTIIQWELHLCPKILSQGKVNLISGKFKAAFNIEQNEYFNLFFSETPITIDELFNMNVTTCILPDVYLEPGDSLVINNIDYTWDGKNIGKGADNKPYFGGDYNIEQWPGSLSNFNDDYIRFWLNKLENRYNNYIQAINKVKNEISSGYYTYLWRNYTYGFFNQKLKIISQYIESYEDSGAVNYNLVFDQAEKLRKRFFPELTSQQLINDSFVNIPNYRVFVDQYMSYQIALKTKKAIKRYQWDPEQVLFNVANEILPVKTKEYYLAYTFIQMLGWPDKKEAVRPFYENFIREFPNTNYSKAVTRAFNSRGDIGKGKPAPDFTLMDQTGKSVSLSSFKGKKVCLYFYRSDLRIAAFNKIISPYPELVKIYVYTGSDTSFFNKNVRLYPDAIHLINTDWALAKEYNVNALILGDDAEIYIIDSEGKILHYYNSIDEGESEYNLFKLFNTSQEASKSSSNMLFIILLILGILVASGGISWFVVRWRASVIHKREEKKRKLVEMELRGIRAQMNPHFMFNSLSSIQNLINQSKVQEANLYLTKFADLMRRILNNAEKSLLPLADEIEAIRTYCELEQLRFDFDFTIETDSKIDAYNIEIPGMLIQPYVENAILHGINNLENQKGKLKITVNLSDNMLCCIVDDNGVGRKASETLKSSKNKHNNGFGLRLTKERLDLLNSQFNQTISVKTTDKVDKNGDAEGTKVELCFPLAD
jgi:hypothetical protein